jgi:hypothetical protein
MALAVVGGPSAIAGRLAAALVSWRTVRPTGGSDVFISKLAAASIVAESHTRIAEGLACSMLISCNGDRITWLICARLARTASSKWTNFE